MKLSFTSAVSLLVLLILIGSAYVYLNTADGVPVLRDGVSTTTQSYECNADGKVCPDGTVVGRTGSACQFSACPGVVPAGGVTKPLTTLHGQVLLSPTCPVERNPPEPGCEPQGYVTSVRIYTPDGEPAGPSVQPNADGTFVFHLPSGAYTLRAQGGPVYPRCEDERVTIATGSSPSIVIMCDSGIR